MFTMILSSFWMALTLASILYTILAIALGVMACFYEKRYRRSKHETRDNR